MIRLDVKSELPRGVRFTNEMVRQLPFTASQALNASVKGVAALPQSKNRSVIADLRRLANQKLDRPKKQVSEGWFATTAKKNNLQSRITPKDKPWDRNRYFVGNIRGGDRPAKWIELEARKLGTLPSNLDLVPTRHVKRDNYGNPKRGQIKTAFARVGSGQTIIGKPDNTSRPYGIYKVIKGGGLQALFVAKESTQYPRPLQNLERYAYARASRTFGPYFRELLEKNVSARVKQGKADLKVGFW